MFRLFRKHLVPSELTNFSEVIDSKRAQVAYPSEDDCSATFRIVRTSADPVSGPMNITISPALTWPNDDGTVSGPSETHSPLESAAWIPRNGAIWLNGITRTALIRENVRWSPFDAGYATEYQNHP